MLSEPWFRTSDGWWYAYVHESGGRRQIRLVTGEDRRDEAWDRWTELRQSLKRTGKLPSESAVTLLDEFLEWCKQNRSAATYQIYLYHLQSFISSIGDRKLVSELKPKDVTAWLAASTWSDSTKAGGAQTVRTAFRWLAGEGHIDRSSVDGARAPAKTRREVIISPETFQKILEKSRPDFRRLLEFVWRTGCRPQEVAWDTAQAYASSPESFHGFYAGEGCRTPIPNAFFDRVISSRVPCHYQDCQHRPPPYGRLSEPFWWTTHRVPSLVQLSPVRHEHPRPDHTQRPLRR